MRVRGSPGATLPAFRQTNPALRGIELPHPQGEPKRGRRTLTDRDAKIDYLEQHIPELAAAAGTHA
jgi:hypothetical protein